MQQKLLYVNGDSWSFRTKECDYPIWPELVQTKVDSKLLNDSLGCGSNSRILDCLKNHYLWNTQMDIMIIGLTCHHRYHVPAPDFGSWVIGPVVAIHEHSGKSNNNIRDFFFSHSYSDLDSVYRYYRDIWSIHEMAKLLGCKVLFFQTWDTDLAKWNLLGSEENIKKYVDTFQDTEYVCTNRYFDALNRLRELSVDWLYHEQSVSSFLEANDLDNTQHPNRSGHEKIAGHVINLLTKYNLL